MNISDETIVLSLIIGVGIGIIYLGKKALIGLFDVKKVGAFIFDFTFVAICTVLTFITALAIDSGKLRFLQLASQLIGAASVIFVFGSQQNKKRSSGNKSFFILKKNKKIEKSPENTKKTQKIT